MLFKGKCRELADFDDVYFTLPVPGIVTDRARFFGFGVPRGGCDLQQIATGC